MTTIAVMNRKGGVGKTTLCHHLAGAIAARGHRVLLIDCDPQGSLTQGALGPTAAMATPASRSVVAAFEGSAELAQVVRGWDDVPDVGIVPSHPALFAYDRMNRKGSGSLNRLAQWLSRGAVEVGHHVCLIDCPPVLGDLATAAFHAAGGLLIPALPEDYSAHGLDPVLKAFGIVTTRGSKREAYRIAITQKRRVKLHDMFVEAIREIHGGAVCEAVVPHLIEVAESIFARMPLSHFRPDCPAAKAFDALAVELLGWSNLPTRVVAEREVANG